MWPYNVHTEKMTKGGAFGGQFLSQNLLKMHTADVKIFGSYLQKQKVPFCPRPYLKFYSKIPLSHT